MVSFRDYIITENKGKEITEDPVTAARLLKRDCKKYFKLLGDDYPLKRYMFGETLLMGMAKKRVRQDRIAMRSSFWNMRFINEWLAKKGHVSRDKAVIATRSYRSGFGEPHYIFPIGKFNYTWVKSKDWNFDDVSGWKGVILWEKMSTEKLEEWIEENGMYITTNRGFNIAYTQGYEIWLDCKEFYYMQFRFYTDHNGVLNYL